MVLRSAIRRGQGVVVPAEQERHAGGGIQGRCGDVCGGRSGDRAQPIVSMVELEREPYESVFGNGPNPVSEAFGRRVSFGCKTSRRVRDPES